MRITVRLYGGLRRYRPAEAPGTGAFALETAYGATPQAVGEQLGIPSTWVRSCFVNTVVARKDQPLHEGDELVLFPPSGGGAGRDWAIVGAV
jgi:molybdopterin converting factor small subunit